MSTKADPRRVGALAQAFELAARMAHSRAHTEGLYPAQWAALRYFKTAEGENRTAVALSRYQGIAFGPVSRTVRTLVGHGLLRKAGSTGKGRGEVIEVTLAGEAALLRDPLAVLVPAMARLSAGEQEALAGALENVLTALAGPQERAEDRPLARRTVNSPQK